MIPSTLPSSLSMPGDPAQRASGPRPNLPDAPAPAIRAMTARAVDPVRPAAAPDRAQDARLPASDLVAPDPNAPTGPPPAFEASLLEVERGRPILPAPSRPDRMLLDLRALSDPAPAAGTSIVA